MVRSQAAVATVDDDLCTGCGSCAATCPFGAISLAGRDGVLALSQVDPLRCVSCGSCVVACPAKAISVPLGSDAEIVAQVEAALAAPPEDGQIRVVAFGCEWSSHAAAELAGASRLTYPAEVRLIRVPCAARFDPAHVLWALHCGADGVFLGGCPPGECHYLAGNRHAQERIGGLQALWATAGFDSRRVSLEWIRPDDPSEFVARITAFVTLVRALGPSPLRMEGAIGRAGFVEEAGRVPAQ
jgi:heterodisulfide reductase subunit A